MRELTTFEISSIAAGEKTICEMTPSELLPYFASVGTAFSLWALGAKLGGEGADAWPAVAVYAVQSAGAVTGLVGGWLAAQLVSEHLSPYL